MNINPGELRSKIEFYTRPSTKDSDGYPTGNDTLVYTCYAKFSRTSGTEAIKSNADFSDVKVRFLIRYTSTSLDTEMFIKYGGLEYEIEYINDYENRHEYIEIIATRVSNG